MLDLTHLRTTTRLVWWDTDTTGTRATIAIASLLWAIALAIDTETLERPAYALMRAFPWWFWACGFGLHGVLALWRIYERRDRPRWGFAVNLLGFIFWVAYTVGSAIALGGLPGGSALECVICLQLAIITIRSGRVREAVSP